MSFVSRLGQALRRSLSGVKNDTARIMRMEVSAMEHATDSQLFFKLATPADLEQIATGSDSDIGGLSRCHFSLERETHEGNVPTVFGRFYGTLSSQIPRGSSLERSGYAAFRNKTRPTLFSMQTWDTSFHPYLAILVRNRLATTSTSSSPSLRSALHANDQTGPAIPRAVEALGLPYGGVPARSPDPPLFFVNIQTDGPVTTDLYQHRLFLDESQGTNWQTITIPFDSFVLTNLGVVSDLQVSMLREKILTVGVSALVDPPLLPVSEEGEPEPATAPETLGALRREPSRGGKRDTLVKFDLDIAGIWAVASPVDAMQLL